MAVVAGDGTADRAREIIIYSRCPSFEEAICGECREALEVVSGVESAGQAEECCEDNQCEKVDDDGAPSDMGQMECSIAFVAVMDTEKEQVGMPRIQQNSASNLPVLARHGERGEWPAVKGRKGGCPHAGAIVCTEPFKVEA